LGIKIDRSVVDGETSKLFRAAIRSKQTLDPYERKLAGFLHWVGTDCDSFVNLAKSNQKDAEKKIVDFIISEIEAPVDLMIRTSWPRSFSFSVFWMRKPAPEKLSKVD
jgi:hypothetical protein